MVFTIEFKYTVIFVLRRQNDLFWGDGKILNRFFYLCLLLTTERSRSASTSKKDEKRKEKPDSVDVSKKSGTSSSGDLKANLLLTWGSWTLWGNLTHDVIFAFNFNSFSFDWTEKEKKQPTVVVADEVGDYEPMPDVENSSTVIEKDLAEPKIVENRWDSG